MFLTNRLEEKEEKEEEVKVNKNEYKIKQQ